MGIVNVTPDSFSDGAGMVGHAGAIEAGIRMAGEGADIIDVGGESTRPGAALVDPAEERARVLPVVAALAARGLVVSVDTRNAATMRAVLDAGARIVNDVSGLAHDPMAAGVVAAAGCPVVLMHMRGTPATMAGLAVYGDVVGEVVRELGQRIEAAVRAGVAPAAIAVDPGIGFAKTWEQSVGLLRGLGAVAALGFPVLVGVSRKSFIGHLTRQPDPGERLGGSLAAGLFALARGAAVLRVHDVRETVRAVAVWRALSA
jgi:dihydropteroate synthase